MKPSEIFKELDLCKEVLAQDYKRRETRANESGVVKVCILGSLCRSYCIPNLTEYDSEKYPYNEIKMHARNLASLVYGISVKKYTELMYEEFQDLVSWNDSEHTTKQDVIELLLEAGL